MFKLSNSGFRNSFCFHDDDVVWFLLNKVDYRLVIWNQGISDLCSNKLVVFLYLYYIFQGFGDTRSCVYTR